MSHQATHSHRDRQPPAGPPGPCRSWAEDRILAAVLAEAEDGRGAWQLPRHTACQAGAQIAVRFAAAPGAGSLTAADVRAVVEGTFLHASAPRRALPADAAAAATGRLVSRLVALGVPMTGQPAATTQRPTRAWNANAVAAVAVVALIAARIGRMARAYVLWRARTSKPVWTIRVPAGRLPAKACLMTSCLVSHVITPGTVLVAGIALTCWPGPWLGWPCWLLAGFGAEKLVNVRLQPAGRM